MGNERQIKSLNDAVESGHSLVLFGTGKLGSYVRKYLRTKNRKLSLLIDNDSSKWGKRQWHQEIVSPEEGVRRYPNGIYIVANAAHSHEMKAQLLGLGVEESSIVVCSDMQLLERSLAKEKQLVLEDKYFIFDAPQVRSVKNCLLMLGTRIQAIICKMAMNMWYPAPGEKKTYYVSICAIFKQEAAYLKEWIEYHKIIGVEHFYLYNNFSTDNFMKILEPYLKNGEVTLIDWPFERAQIAAYRDCIQRFQHESQWIGLIDLDEFVVPLTTNNLSDFLGRFKHRGSVLIYWKFFCSSGRWSRDKNRLITEDFTVCWPKHANIGKCFFNTDYELWDTDFSAAIHHYMWTACKGRKYPPVNIFDQVCLGNLHIAKPERFPIQINHYYSKSFMEYQEKIGKGDVFFKENTHTNDSFFYHEMKCTEIDMCIYKYLILLKQRMEGR